MGKYRLVPVRDSAHQWRLLVRRTIKGHVRWVCVAIGTGYRNMQELRKALRR